MAKVKFSSKRQDKFTGEYLVSAALIRNKIVESRGFKEHWQIRAALGDKDPYTKQPGDEHGFLTSTGQFVDRNEAREIGAKAGQCSSSARELLSSDIDSWNPRP